MLYLSHSPVKGIICERFQLHEVSLDGAGSVTEASSCCKLISSLNLVLEDAGIEEAIYSKTTVERVTEGKKKDE